MMRPRGGWHARAADWRARAAQAAEDLALPGLGVIARAQARRRIQEALEMAKILDGFAASGAPAPRGDRA